MAFWNTNPDLMFDTEVMRKTADNLSKIGVDMRDSATELNKLLTELKDTYWTTNAGIAFQEMCEVNWEQNIKKYADLLDMLHDCLYSASDAYDDLVDNYINAVTFK